MQLGVFRQVGRFLSMVIGIIALLFVLLYVFLNVHPVAWQYGKEFEQGTAPGTLTGVYDGVLLAPAIPSKWQGKQFMAGGTGVNRWAGETRYPFTFRAVGTNIEISYDQPANSWFVRRVIDEVVRRPDGSLLGRMSIQLFFGWRMPVGWFLLTPAQ